MIAWRLEEFGERCKDAIWPSVQQDANDSEKDKASKQARLAIVQLAGVKDLDTLRESLSASSRLVTEENARKSSIESRLLSLAGLASIAATVVLGTLFTLASEKTSTLAPAVRLFLAMGCLYLSLQLVAALIASVRGLQATGYSALIPLDLVPRHSSTLDYYRQLIGDQLEQVSLNRVITNEKLDQLAVAHCALRNFLWGLLTLALLAALAISGSALREMTAGARPPSMAPASQEAAREQPPSAGFESLLQTTDWTATFLTAAGASLTVLGLFVALTSSSRSRRLVGIAAASTGLGLSVLGGAKFEATGLKIDKLIGELKLELSMKASPKAQVTLVRRVATVGPFKGGEHVMARGGVAQCVNAALAQHRALAVGGWEVVGRVDKRALRADRAAIYGSNQALAMARANWVAHDLLAGQASFDPQHVVISVGGARAVGTHVAVDEMTSDRAVDVFVTMTVAKDSKAPVPVVCRPESA